MPKERKCSQALLGSTTQAGTAATLKRLQIWDKIRESEGLQVEMESEFEEIGQVHLQQRLSNEENIEQK